MERAILATVDGYRTIEEAVICTDEQQTLDMTGEATEEAEAPSDDPSAES